jgi:hypothetical protein
MIITGAKSDHWQAQDRATCCCIGKDCVNGAKVNFFLRFSHALSMRSLLSVGLFERELWTCDDCMTAFLPPDLITRGWGFSQSDCKKTWREMNWNIKKVRRSSGLYACPFSLPAPVSFSWRSWNSTMSYFNLFFPFLRQPTWLRAHAMGKERIWVKTSIGYERFDCTVVVLFSSST